MPVGADPENLQVNATRLVTEARLYHDPDRAVAEATKEAQNLAVLVAVADPAQLSDAVTLVNQRGSRGVGLVLADRQTLGAADRGSASGTPPPVRPSPPKLRSVSAMAARPAET